MHKSERGGMEVSGCTSESLTVAADGAAAEFDIVFARVHASSSSMLLEVLLHVLQVLLQAIAASAGGAAVGNGGADAAAA